MSDSARAAGSRAGVADVSDVAAHWLCMGCGTCQAVCPLGAVRVVLEPKTGSYRPLVDGQLCTGCGSCLSVCPGLGVDIDRLAGDLAEATHHHPYLGYYRDLSVGHAVEPMIRRESSSGGLVSALLVYALEAGRIDGAIVVGGDPEDPLLTRSFIAEDRDGVLAAMGSKYCPSRPNVMLSELLHTPGRYAFVGLPCHIHALRMWQEREPLLRERLRYVLGLFCLNNNTYHGTKRFLRAKGHEPSDVTALRYRGEGWPGRIGVETATGTHSYARSTTETRRFARQILRSAFHQDFMIPRCLVCCDHTAELADVSFGDPHLPEWRANETEGVSWWIVRNDAGTELIREAVSAGVIEASEFSEDSALKAQNYGFKAAVGQRFALWHIIGRPLPGYDREIPFRVVDAVKARSYVLSLLTHTRVGRVLVPGVVVFRFLGVMMRRVRRGVVRRLRQLVGGASDG